MGSPSFSSGGTVPRGSVGSVGSSVASYDGSHGHVSNKTHNFSRTIATQLIMAVGMSALSIISALLIISGGSHNTEMFKNR